jgi:hypothetical protein
MDAVFPKEEREGALKLVEIGLWLCGGWVFLNVASQSCKDQIPLCDYHTPYSVELVLCHSSFEGSELDARKGCSTSHPSQKR